MPGLNIGYARVSTDQQDLTAQRDGLQALGVQAERMYVDHGLTGTNRERPGLHQALAACRAGDTLVVTKLDRLARSLPDARAIADELTQREVKLNLGGSVHDPTDPVGRLLFNVLAMVAEFESDLIRMRTGEGMKVAKAKGRLRGKQGFRPQVCVRQRQALVAVVVSGAPPPRRAAKGRARRWSPEYQRGSGVAADLTCRAGWAAPVGYLRPRASAERAATTTCAEQQRLTRARLQPGRPGPRSAPRRRLRMDSPGNRRLLDSRARSSAPAASRTRAAARKRRLTLTVGFRRLVVGTPLWLSRGPASLPART